ncbi:hypothetical protein ACFFRR_006085 [Megaselia abdita]
MKLFVCILALAVVAINGQKQLGNKCTKVDLWTDINDLVNPNQYYECESGKTVVRTCAQGRGFAIEENINGCIPYELWPCLEKNGGYPGSQNCKNSPVTPWAAADPNQYYICVNNKPSYALNCRGVYGSAGFFRDDSITTPNEEALGCLDWATWRNKTGCDSTS